MEALADLRGEVRLDPAAFFRNDDGTWTVLSDTKILSGQSERANTLLLPGGTRIEERMFWANQIDLVDILDLKGARTAAKGDTVPMMLENNILHSTASKGPTIPPVSIPGSKSGSTLKVALLLAAVILELGWVGGLGWMFFSLVAA